MVENPSTKSSRLVLLRSLPSHISLILYVTQVSTLHANLLKLVDMLDKRQCSSVLKRVIPRICF